MTLEAVKKLKEKMNWKQIYFDIPNECYRLIDKSELYEYKDEEGKWHQRSQTEINNLILITS